MAKSNPYAGFEVGALKGILDAAGVKYPSDASQATLADLVQETERAVGKAGFAQIVASLNGVNAQAPSGGGSTTTTQQTSSIRTRSMTPGTSTLWSFIPALGSVTSDTWDPPTPLEYGRTVT